ncbi:hypothetical protein [Fodinibius sp. AD559]|uniref:hypothetical protein n=1 Tax=Fodinibius sp. AD559 TaxID=3424179 RepID=UPI004046F4C9
MSKDKSNSKRLKSISIHEGRLRKLIQFLKKREALVTIDYDPYGAPKTTKYSSSKETENSLKELILNVWPEATDSAYYEYLKTDYKAHRKTTVKTKHHPSYEKFIKDIRCTFKENAHLDQKQYKEQLFFSGVRRQQTNLLAAFPKFRKNIITEINQFVGLLESDKRGFPYQRLRNHTSLRCHRYKQLEKDIFQYFKDTDSSTLQEVRSNFSEIMKSFIKHLGSLEKEGAGHEQPDGLRILDNRLQFKELSDPKNMKIESEEQQRIKEIGFEETFSNQSEWFNRLRFKKITYWKNELSDLPISDWPPFYLEHILLAYFELNTVCSQIVTLRDQLFDQVGFYVTYSKDGQKLFTIEEVLTPKQLSTILSQYEYQSNSFVNALRSDGNLLQKPLQKLPERLEHFDKLTSPDNLFYSRIQKLIWEYLLYRMCGSCQPKRDHVAEFYNPHYRSN